MVYLKKLVILIICVFICFFISISIIESSSFNASENHLVTTKPSIIIDAGHGGFDGGASTSEGVAEKGINLAISLYLKDYLEFFGFNVIMTRDDDSSTESDSSLSIRSKKTSDLHNRMELMKKTENSIFVSVHQNFFTLPQYSGAQVFYSPQFSEQSSFLAECIQDSIVSNLQNDNKRQIKACGTSVYLIYNAVKPAVLVECGFLSNYEESQRLQNEEYQRKMAFSIATGILKYCEGL